MAKKVRGNAGTVTKWSMEVAVCGIVPVLGKGGGEICSIGSHRKMQGISVKSGKPGCFVGLTLLRPLCSFRLPMERFAPQSVRFLFCIPLAHF